MAVTFEPVMEFGCPSGFKKVLIPMTKSILKLEELSLTVWAWRRRKAVLGKGSLTVINK